MWFWKKTTVPVTNEVTQVQSLQTWSVRWESRHGRYSGSTNYEAEFFTSGDAVTVRKEVGQ